MSCGIDIIEIKRIKNAFLKFKRFGTRVFTERELKYFAESGGRFEALAGMFAAKEAYAKYRGSGISGITFRDIEVCHDDNGKPYICVRGEKSGAALSISHCRDYAAAVVTDGEKNSANTVRGAENSGAGGTKEYTTTLPRRDKCGGVIFGDEKDNEEYTTTLPRRDRCGGVIFGDEEDNEEYTTTLPRRSMCGGVIFGDEKNTEEYTTTLPRRSMCGGVIFGDEEDAEITANVTNTACGASRRREYARAMKALIPARAEDANKGSCGRVAIIAGSRGMTGAAALSALGALRGGAGLVTVFTPSSEQPVLAVKLTEAMTVPLPHENGVISAMAADTVLERIQNADAVVFGPGLGKGGGILPLLERIVREFTKTLIIDADGINALSANIDILKDKKCSVILTPHPGEMSRLTGLSIAEIQSARIKTAADFAERYDVTVALKGAGTVIAARGGKTAVNPSGNCGMATGGTGDVLSGVVAALAAQGCTPYDSARLGVYLHGLAGDIAAREKGVHSLIASDVCGSLPAAFIKTLSER